MIAEMKKTYIVVQSSKTKKMLSALRKMGVLHVKRGAPLHQGSLEEYESVSAIISVLEELVDKRNPVSQKPLSKEAVVETAAHINTLLARKAELIQKRDQDALLVERLVPWGDFDPAELVLLKEAGYELFFYTIGKKDLALLGDEITYFDIAYDGSLKAIATLGVQLDPSSGATPVPFTSNRLSTLQVALEQYTKELASIEDNLRKNVASLDALKSYQKALQLEVRFEEVEASVVGDEELVYLQGYLPTKDQERFEESAQKNGWAYLLEAVQEDDEDVPTLIEYKKGFGIIKPVFDILGTVPGYREHDISTWFLLFFTLFFAMIVGDAGYGLIFLLAAVGLHVWAKKASTLVLLLYVLSIATIGWGSITGTWFGSLTILQSIPFLQKLVIPSISNYPELFGVSAVGAQHTVMKFCFMIGTVQLTLACVINIITKARSKDISLIADLFWLIALLALYYIVLLLVVGTEVQISLLFAVVGSAFVFILLFGAQGPGISFISGMKAGLGGFFTTFLDTISAFSNIMSYIRLFAVGMASVAIAQSFNAMAAGMLKGFALPAGILVLVIGHSLNLVMGLLSVVVHGVRLNLLEFSGQLGMEWTGIQYQPFDEMGNE